MRKYPTRQMLPTGVAPTAMGPGVAPFTPTAPVAPAPMAAPTFPAAAPSAVAPVRRVVHPTRYAERHTVTRYPIENIYPSHVHNVHHNVCEYYCSYPHTESHQVCNHTVNHCCPPPRRPC